MVRDIDPSVTTLLAGYEPHVRDVALRLRDLVLELAPAAIEQADVPARLLGYCFLPTYRHTICVIMLLRQGVNLGFPHGAVMADPAGLLTGTGKKARHVRITSPEQIDSPPLHVLLEEAVKMTPRADPIAASPA